jgi:hypothetical protein
MPDTTSMSAILVDVDSIFDAGMGMVGTVISTITSNTLLLFFVLLSVVGLGIGLVGRLLHAK